MLNSIWTRVHGASLATVVLLATGTLLAQESKTSKSDAPARRPADTARRVPAYFGQIGLTPEQREAIYKIRGKHQARVDELEKQIDETQAQMLGECEGVLSDAQKQMVEQRRKAASAGRKVQETEKPGKMKTGSGA